MAIPNLKLRHLSGALLAIVLSCPLLSNAETTIVDNVVYTINDAEATVTGLDDTSLTTDLVIPSTIEVNGLGYTVTAIDDQAFRHCDKITTVTLGNAIATIGCEAFSDCPRITSVSLGNGLLFIDDEAFYGCTSLQSFSVDAENAYFAANSAGGLFNKDFTVLTLCPGGKTSFDIPETVTAIGEGAFEGCSKLVTVNIPNSVTSIEDFAFDECSSLIHLTIPKSVTAIGDYTFYECTGLKSVTCVWDAPLPVISDEWIFDSETYEKCPLYVPIGTKAKYAEVEPWSKFSNIYERQVGNIEEICGRSEASAIATDGAILISGDTAAHIVSAGGTTIYSGCGNARIAVTPGVYIVILDTRALKVTVQ
jgi:hypothetical protein